MENAKLLLQEIKDENAQLFAQQMAMASIKRNISSRLSLLLEEINKIFAKIKMCENEKEASMYFKFLEEIQGIVSILISEGNVKISGELWKFYKDFDRLDLVPEREHLFNEIKGGRYLLESK